MESPLQQLQELPDIQQQISPSDTPPEMVRQSAKHRPLGKGQPEVNACQYQEKKVATCRTHASEGAHKKKRE